MNSNPSIKVRKVNFKFEMPFKNHYFKDNPFTTHFINSLHLLFPEGEKYFINSLWERKKDIHDEILLKQIKDFCGQEGTHSKEHEKFWAVLSAHGYKLDPFLNHVKWMLNIFVSKNAKIALGKNANVLLTACLEHFTALFAKSTLETVDMSNADALLSEMFKWHAAEEIEHKAVAFDAYVALEKNEYVKRLLAMPVVTFLLYLYITMGMVYMISQDKDIIWEKTPNHFKEFLLEFLPQLHQSVVKDYFDFYGKKFHPNQHSNFEMAAKFFEDKSYA
jgi:predicted metal-dependent hydrolase